MKKISTLLLSFLAMTFMFAQGIQFFEGSFEDAMAKAKKQNKLIFVDAYTTWCGPCKMMSRDIFPEELVGEFYNKNFINLKIDQEKGEGLEFAKTYNVRFYPTLLFINSAGELAHKAVGYMDAAEFIELGKAANSEKTQMLSLMKMHDEGKLNPAKTKQLANVLLDAYMAESEDVAFAYLKTQEDWRETENLQFIFKHFPSKVESEVFSFVLKEIEMFDKLMLAPNQLNNKISKTIGNTLNNRENLSEEDINGFFKDYFPETWEIEAEKYIISSFQRNPETKNSEEFFSRKIAFLEKYGTESWEELNSVAWGIYETFDDREYLEVAKKLAKQSIEINTNYYNTDTYTWICVKLGDLDSASKYGVKAKKLGEMEGADVSELEELLNSIEK